MKYLLKSGLLLITVLLLAGCYTNDCSDKIDMCYDTPIENTTMQIGSIGWFYDESTNTCIQVETSEGPTGFATEADCMNYCGCD